MLSRKQALCALPCTPMGLRCFPHAEATAAEAVAVLERAGAVHFKRAALAMLRERADAVTPAASETVRTT